VANAVLRHGSHAFFHIVARGHGDHRAGHDLSDQGLSRRAVIQNHLGPARRGAEPGFSRPFCNSPGTCCYLRGQTN
jgi:hypothetical protein